MRTIALGLFATALFALPAAAQTPLTFADVDSNGDGRLSYAELQMVWPDLTAEEFTAADIEGAGGLTPAQLDTLQPSSVPAAVPDPAPTELAPLPGEVPSEPTTPELIYAE